VHGRAGSICPVFHWNRGTSVEPIIARCGTNRIDEILIVNTAYKWIYSIKDMHETPSSFGIGNHIANGITVVLDHFERGRLIDLLDIDGLLVKIRLLFVLFGFSHPYKIGIEKFDLLLI
jgi:hypothetical protein